MENHQLSLHPPTLKNVILGCLEGRYNLCVRVCLYYVCVRKRGLTAKCSQVSMAINVFIAPSHTRMEHYF